MAGKDDDAPQPAARVPLGAVAVDDVRGRGSELGFPLERGLREDRVLRVLAPVSRVSVEEVQSANLNKKDRKVRNPKSGVFLLSPMVYYKSVSPLTPSSDLSSGRPEERRPGMPHGRL